MLALKNQEIDELNEQLNLMKKNVENLEMELSFKEQKIHEISDKNDREKERTTNMHE